MSARPLAKALHTVTSTARVAAYLREQTRGDGRDAEDLTFAALAVLGYTRAQIDTRGPLFLACVAAVSKGA